MISHVIGTMSDKSVFGFLGLFYIKFLYIMKRTICKNMRIRKNHYITYVNCYVYIILKKVLLYLYYLQTANEKKIKEIYISFIQFKSVFETLRSLLNINFLLFNILIFCSLLLINNIFIISRLKFKNKVIHGILYFVNKGMINLIKYEAIKIKEKKDFFKINDIKYNDSIKFHNKYIEFNFYMNKSYYE
jgi:hypothetical protein